MWTGLPPPTFHVLVTLGLRNLQVIETRSAGLGVADQLRHRFLLVRHRRSLVAIAAVVTPGVSRAVASTSQEAPGMHDMAVAAFGLVPTPLPFSLPDQKRLLVEPGRLVPRGVGDLHRQVEALRLASDGSLEVVGVAVVVDDR